MIWLALFCCAALPVVAGYLWSEWRQRTDLRDTHLLRNAQPRKRLR